ncbi:MCE family protein [uncultured Jatrophihabitans sp.]|uniref:MCE family protein n=1 Tax=uncultured Jatrophihabitans sp. TaxID=1610747 RepID=UPI0035CBB6D2
MKKMSKSLGRIVVLVVVLAIVGTGAYFVFFNGSDDKKVSANFAEAVGIYTGTPVKILGVNVGTVDSVKPGPTGVKVTMSYDSAYKLPANVQSIEVANSLVSDRYIQLAPVYKSGAVMRNGGTISTKNTSGPAELDDIYASLNKLSVALGPKGANKGGKQNGALSTLLKVSAANLKGNGAALGNSITQLSKAARTLSDSRGDLFQTVANLRTFTGALKSSDGQVRLFNTQLAQVAGDLASERTDLGAALHDLGIALNNVNTFVKANAGKLHTSIAGLRTLTGVLVNEKGSLEETLAVAPVALANIVHAYSPTVGGIATRSNLSSLTNPVSFCQVLNQSITTNLISLPAVTTLTQTLATECKTVLTTNKLPFAGITQLLGSLTGGSGGGLPTGGGVLPGAIGSGTGSGTAPSLGSSGGDGLKILTGGLAGGSGS